MRVGIIIGEITTWLAGNPALSEREHSSVSDFRITPQINVQQKQTVRGAASSFSDRKNLATTLSFGTSRLFATAEAAEAWSLDYDQAFPRTGTLVMASVLPGGGVRYRYMAGAVIQPPERIVTGCTVQLRYVIVGGKILSTPT